MNKNKIALVFGSFAAFMHLVWSVLVGLGWAQPLINFIYNIHMLSNPPIVMAFNIGKAFALVLVTFAVAYIMGRIFAFFWSKINN